jgi:hypothetical protein
VTRVVVAVVLAVLLAGCGPNYAPPGVVESLRDYRVGGVHSHLVTVRPDGGGTPVEVSVSRRTYRARPAGARWPDCAGGAK